MSTVAKFLWNIQTLAAAVVVSWRVLCSSLVAPLSAVCLSAWTHSLLASPPTCVELSKVCSHQPEHWSASQGENGPVGIRTGGMRFARPCVGGVDALRRGDVQTRGEDVVWQLHRLADALFICRWRLRGKKGAFKKKKKIEIQLLVIPR